MDVESRQSVFARATVQPDYRRVFEASAAMELVIQPDAALTVVGATHAMLHALSRSRAEVIGRSFPSLFLQNPDHTSVLRHVIQRRAEESTTLQRHEIVDRVGGSSVHWWSVTFVPVFVDSRVTCVTARFSGSDEVSRTRSGTRDAVPPLVLIVEDDSVLNKLIATTLEPYYRVISSFDGLEGLQAATAFNPDLILCDLGLPGIDGEQFVREVRLWSALDRTPILIITASEDADLRSRLIDVGAQDYLTKPFSMAEVRLRAGGLIARRFAAERERELADELSARKELERSRAEWAAIVAHDLRQPVNAMVVAAAVLAKSHERGDGETERAIQRRSIDRLLTTAGRMSAMVDDLLDVSNIEARCFSIERRASFLPEVIDEALAGWSDSLDRFRVELVDDRVREPLWIDPNRILQVLTNLLSNAVKYSTPGSTIRIAASAGSGHVELTVANVGRPVSEAELQRVFERYARSRESRKAPGLGLGLFICRGIVEAHGGRIWATSHADEVVFHVRLPKRDPGSRSSDRTNEHGEHKSLDG